MTMAATPPWLIRSIRARESGAEFDMSYPTEPIAWSDGYGDLWGLQVNFRDVARLHPATSSTKTIYPGVNCPATWRLPLTSSGWRIGMGRGLPGCRPGALPARG